MLKLWRRAADYFWRIFISLKLTFILLTIISVGAVLGMSYDQTLGFAEFQTVLAQKTALSANLIQAFELYDAFHSWWFSLAIIFLAANLVACSFERLPKIYFDQKKPRPYLTKRRLLGLSLKQELKVSSEEEALALINKFRPGLKEKEFKSSSKYFFKDELWFGRFGVYVVHIALLVIMFSSIYATQNGVDGMVMVDEGSKTRFITARGAGGLSYIHDLGFYVGCTDFRLRTFTDNSPMEYESDLYIKGHDQKPVISKTVRVNEPLSYAGYSFYQSSYRPIISEKEVELKLSYQDGGHENIKLALGKEHTMPSGRKIIAQKLYEDFAGLGQAVKIIEKNGDEENYFHVFRRHPNFDSVVRNAPYSVIFLGADQNYATGLSVGFVPGLSVIFSGFLLLIIGLYLCFFTNPIRYFARIDKNKDHYQVVLAAQGYRNPLEAKAVFLKKVEALSKDNNHG